MKAEKGKSSSVERDIYNRQNRTIHKARAQLCIELDDCRELARSLNGKPSLRLLNLRQRWELIEILKAKGATVFNPALPKHHIYSTREQPAQKEPQDPERSTDMYPTCLAYWEKRFPGLRPGFASNRQLAWIESIWRLDFDDGRAGQGLKGLRGFIFRQTRGLEGGPVSDLAFLRENQVEAVLTPLKSRMRKELPSRSNLKGGRQ